MKFRQKVLAFLMVVTGSLHFLKTDFYLKIMPDYLPYPRVLVLLSGSAAIMLGILMIWTRFRKVAVWGVIAYLTAVFPANIHMTLHPEIFPAIPVWLAWTRLPLQGVFIYGVYLCSPVNFSEEKYQ